MSRSWVSFIAAGDPNNANVLSKVKWRKYWAEVQQIIVWQTQGSVVERDVSEAKSLYDETLPLTAHIENLSQERIQFIFDNRSHWW
ncbi:hypothetical protein B0H19DRAFT_1257320 [Mycena capillaripes]|nr:hypothetical protein B0H19DRAFT_1257320 [Mycena capillaripes]